MKKKSIFYNLICPIASIFIVIGVWAIVAAVYDKPLIFPKVGDVFVSFFRLFGEGAFYAALGSTFARSLACFALAFVFALPLAFASAFCKTVAQMVKPVVDLLRSVPVIAVILIALVTFSSSVLPIAVGFLTLFPLLYTAFWSTLTSNKLTANLAMCSLYNVRKRDKVRYVILPELSPVAFVQADTLLPLAVKVVISGEVLAYSRESLGLLMKNAQTIVQTDKLVAYAFVAILLSYLAKLLVFAIKYAFRRLKLCR